MPSEQVQLLIAGYILGDLDPNEAAEFERLLVADPTIMQEVVQTQRALDLAYAPAEVAPPPQLRNTIIAAASSRSSTPPSVLRPVRSGFPWSKTMGLAAAGLIVALAINNYRLWQTLQATQVQPEPETFTYVLQGDRSTQTAAAAAVVVVNPETLEASLTAQDLPPLPPGKVYALWTLPKPGAPFTTDAKGAILMGTFQVDPQGNASKTVVVPEVYRSRDLVAKVAVTVEDATAPQRHQGKPVMITGS